MTPILVVTTGGTIDKAYFDALSTYQIGESVVAKLLHIAHVTQTFRVVEFSRKDSLDLRDEDRDGLRAVIAAAAETHVVVTHGTDTMTETANVLTAIANKTIVLTGALAPARFAESDASFNLGMAFGVAQTAASGVYIAMNGQVFRAGTVRKDRLHARFVPIEDA
jgi:L-asparaginase